MVIFSNTNVGMDYSLLCQAPIFIHSRSSFSQTAGFINLAMNPNGIQYIPFYPGDGKGIKRYLEYRSRTLRPVMIEGKFGEEVQSLKKNGRVAKEEILKLYSNNQFEPIITFKDKDSS